MVVEFVARIKIDSGNNDSGCCFPTSREFPKSLFGRIFRGIGLVISFAWLLFGTYMVASVANKLDGIEPPNNMVVCNIPRLFAITVVTIRKIWPSK